MNLPMMKLQDGGQTALLDFDEIRDAGELTTFSFFSGGGVFDQGFKDAGYNVTVANECDPFAADFYEMNHKDTKLYRDAIQFISTQDLLHEHGRPEVILLTFPCTNYSAMANLHGNRHHDSVVGGSKWERYAERGGDLFLHACRMVAWMQPKAFVIENVPGIKGMKIVMDTIKNIPMTRTGEKLGTYYTFTYDKVNTKDFGLPQNRERIIIVGTSKKLKKIPSLRKRPLERRHIVGEILEENPDVPGLDGIDSLPDYIRRRLTGEPSPKTGKPYRDKPSIKRNAEDEIANTCVAHYRKDQGTSMVEREPGIITPYSIYEQAALQGMEGFKLPQTLRTFEVIGNAVSRPVGFAIAEALLPAILSAP